MKVSMSLLTALCLMLVVGWRPVASYCFQPCHMLSLLILVLFWGRVGVAVVWSWCRWHSRQQACDTMQCTVTVCFVPHARGQVAPCFYQLCHMSRASHCIALGEPIGPLYALNDNAPPPPHTHTLSYLFACASSADCCLRVSSAQMLTYRHTHPHPHPPPHRFCSRPCC